MVVSDIKRAAMTDTASDHFEKSRTARAASVETIGDRH